MRRLKKAASLALAASFCIYLIPIVTPHTAWFLGEAVFAREARAHSRWLALNFSVALGFQIVAAALLYWCFRAPSLRRALALVPAFLVIAVALQPLYLAYIPAVFLEEPDTAAEKLAWPAACTVPGAFQTNFATPGELWIRYSNAPENYAVLAPPACALTPAPLPKPHSFPGGRVDFMIDVTSVVPHARGVVQKQETQSGAISWWMLPGLVPLQPPPGHSGFAQPVLSTDGEWAAWLENIPGTGPPVLYRVILRPLGPGTSDTAVDLTPLGPATYVLKSVDMGSRRLTLWKTDHLISIDFEGRLENEFAAPTDLRPQQNTYLRAGDSWLAWDAYRENEPYRLEWALPGGSGSHRVPLGRTIHSAAFDPSGRYIAVSVGTSLNIGSARDSVYVLSAADGHEVFRRYLPSYTRTPVAFLGDRFFAYSDLNGVNLLRIPE